MTEECEVCNDSHPKARKAHRCQECYGKIEVGEVYVKYSGVFDGSGFTHKMCSDCFALIKEMDEGKRFDDRVPFGDLCEFASEEGDDRLRKYAAIRAKRGANIPDWMRERLAEIPLANPTPPAQG